MVADGLMRMIWSAMKAIFESPISKLAKAGAC
jgi:hypothetical protein